MHLDYTTVSIEFSGLIFAPPKRYLISRKCLLKCLDPLSRTLAEASDVALCHQGPWLCSCTRCNSMFWFKKKTTKKHPTKSHTLKKPQPPQSKPIWQLLRDWDLLGMSSLLGQGQMILLRAYSLYRKSWDSTFWNFNNISDQLSFGWFEDNC